MITIKLLYKLIQTKGDVMNYTDLQSSSMVSVHFIQRDKFNKLNFELNDVSVFEGNISHVKNELDLFSVISTTLKFPAYFGQNWDALDECLTDLDWLDEKGFLLVLHDASTGWSNNPYILGSLVTAWLEASEYWFSIHVPFHLVFVM